MKDLDPILHSQLRLAVMSILMNVDEADFVYLKQRTDSTSGTAVHKQVIIGFALETDHFEEHAAEKLEKSGADALLLNAPVAADSGFGRDCVRFALVETGKPVPPLAMGEKVDLAETILNFCLERLNG